jgi:integrase
VDGEQYELATVGNVNVKIYRRERDGGARWVFEVADYTAGARRLRGFAKLEKARAEAARIAEQLSTGNATAAAMTAHEAASFGRASELLRPTGIALEVAAGIVAKAVSILGSDRILEACNFFQQRGADSVTNRTVAEAATELVEHRTAQGKSARYLRDLRERLARFTKSFAVDIGSITTADVQRWLDGLGVGARSVKNYRGALSTLFSFAEARGYVARNCNPVVATEQPTSNGDGAIEIFTPQEIEKLLEHAPKRFLPFLAIGAFAGLRTAEIERLDWKEIDTAGGFIHVSGAKAKTRSRRLVPILPNLAKWIASFTNRRGRVWTGNEKELLADRAAACQGAGLEWRDNGTRHSWISYRLADIQNAAQTALEAGNSPTMVFRHYRELVKPEAAKAWFAIGPKV